MDAIARAPESSWPYPQSWVDRLLGWLERRRLSVPLVCVGLWIVLVTVVHLNAWREGIVPQWQLDARVFLVNAWAPYCLALIYYLKKAAEDALIAFRPAIDVAGDAFEQLRYEFTVLPKRGVLLSNALGALAAFLALSLFPETGKPFMDTPRAAVVNMGLTMAASAVSAAAIYLTIRQLRLIGQTYSQAARLDLFRANELYAFSALTLRTGIGWLIAIYAGAAFYPALQRNIPWVATAGLILAGIAFAFVRTLFDIHTRILKEKTQHLEEIDSRLQAAFAASHRSIDANDVPQLAPLREVMDTLLVERGVVTKIPTWPWQPGTLASFLAAVLLPLGVWAIQQVLLRFMQQ